MRFGTIFGTGKLYALRFVPQPGIPALISPTRIAVLLTLLAGGWGVPARAGDRLDGTGAVTQIEGAAGGGLVPWALIGGLGTDDQIGATAVATEAHLTVRAGSTEDIEARPEIATPVSALEPGRQPSP